jgi:hypothetical protein
MRSFSIAHDAGLVQRDPVLLPWLRLPRSGCGSGPARPRPPSLAPFASLRMCIWPSATPASFPGSVCLAQDVDLAQRDPVLLPWVLLPQSGRGSSRGQLRPSSLGLFAWLWTWIWPSATKFSFPGAFCLALDVDLAQRNQVLLPWGSLPRSGRGSGPARPSSPSLGPFASLWTWIWPSATNFSFPGAFCLALDADLAQREPVLLPWVCLPRSGRGSGQGFSKYQNSGHLGHLL